MSRGFERDDNGELVSFDDGFRTPPKKRTRHLLMTWQPIETAPKDGTDVIVYRPKFDGTYIPQVGMDWWSERLGGVWAKSRKDVPPTHWMALPKPPSLISD